MAAGKPVVVTRSGGPAEIVDDGRTGTLVVPRDPAALANGILAMLRDPQRAAAIARNAQASVEERFSLAAMISRYEQLYAELLGTAAAAATKPAAALEARQP
jgi:glycosyltransferase involved in cell wall biosynthesis